MKKLLFMLLSVAMLASMASCGDKEGPTPATKNFMMLYRVVMAKNVFNYGNPTLQVLDPVKNTTLTIDLNEDMDNRFQTEYSLDYAVVKTAMSFATIDPNDMFVYYYPVYDIKKDMKFDATLNLNIDEAKTSAVGPTDKVVVSKPALSASFIETSGALAAVASLSMSRTTLTGDKSIEYYTKYQTTTASGTVTW